MSNTAERPISVEHRRRLVTGSVDAGDATVLSTGDGDRILVDSRTDLAAARRVRGSFRRVDRVELVFSDAGSASAAVHAVGHRLPVCRRVSVGAALGLARLGVPTVVETTVRGES
ncbi:MAG: hypothetical protein ACE367_24605 [Acidimicrobiales bacterium]